MRLEPCLVSRLNLTSQFVIVVDPAHNILMCNSMLKSKIGDVTSLSNIFGTEDKKVKSLIDKSFEKKVMHDDELSVDFGNGEELIFLSVYPLCVESDAIATLEFHPIASFLEFEAMLFELTSKRPSDSKWVLRDNLETIHAQANEGSIFYGLKRGFNLLDAVIPEDHVKCHNSFNLARVNPFKKITTQVMAYRRQGGQRSIEADVVFMPDPFYGDRFFITTRTTNTQQASILKRLQEAWKVENRKELSEKLETSPGAISEAANGLRKMPNKWIVRTLYECKVTSDWLLYGVGPKRSRVVEDFE